MARRRDHRPELVIRVHVRQGFGGCAGTPSARFPYEALAEEDSRGWRFTLLAEIQDSGRSIADSVEGQGVMAWLTQGPIAVRSGDLGKSRLGLLTEARRQVTVEWSDHLMTR